MKISDQVEREIEENEEIGVDDDGEDLSSVFLHENRKRLGIDNEDITNPRVS